MDLELDDPKSKSNSLSIRLTESAVFLRTDGHAHVRGRHYEQRPTQLRGLLILQLVKPTRIKSIDVDLTATSSSSWIEGLGARRVDITEEHRVFHATTLYFRASKAHARRTASIGPGISYNRTAIDDDSNDWDASSHTNGTPIHTTASTASTSNTNNEINTPSQPVPHISIPTPRSRSSFLNQRIENRHMSVDASQFRRMPLDEPDEAPTRPNIHQLPPIPPYSTFALPAMTSDTSYFPTAHGVNTNLVSTVSNDRPPPSPVPSLENSRHSPYASLRGRPTSLSRSRHEDVIPEDDTVDVESEPNINARINLPTLRLIPTAPSSPALTSPPSSPISIPVDSHSPISPSIPRGRKRFSFSSVSNVFIDAVRASSPRSRTNRFAQSREREYGKDRERSVDTPTTRDRRGRTMERGGLEGDHVILNGDNEKDSKPVKEKARGIIAMMLGEKEKSDAEDWKEFKKGTYTFPISFSIPGNAPPTMVCDYGSVDWRLKANVHRPGTFKSKMTAVREVITVACPTSEDTEDTENIIVERHWDQQLQYLISVSGRSFHVGGIVPVSFTLLPLAKISVYRLSVILEERVDYYTNMRRIARTDPVARFSLLSIKGDDNHTPILPLQTSDPEALRHSPLYALVDPNDDLSEAASTLKGPGPWTLHQDLKLPGSCSQMKFSNKNRKSNIIVTHTLKLVMRVERGDDLYIDAKTGKRKLFDIVVQTPVLILSCRCNPEWTCLPRYSEVLDSSISFIPNCPCRAPPHPNLISTPTEAVISSRSSDSGASAAETSSINLPSSTMASLRQPRFNEAIIRSNSLYERLVSGQESVSGEVPPAYDVAGSRPTMNGVAVR